MSPLDIATAVTTAIFSIAGVLAIGVAVVDADWFFTSANVRAITGRMSRRASRIIYFIIGAAVLGMAVKIFFDSST